MMAYEKGDQHHKLEHTIPKFLRIDIYLQNEMHIRLQEHAFCGCIKCFLSESFFLLRIGWPPSNKL